MLGYIDFWFHSFWRAEPGDVVHPAAPLDVALVNQPWEPIVIVFSKSNRCSDLMSLDCHMHSAFAWFVVLWSMSRRVLGAMVKITDNINC